MNEDQYECQICYEIWDYCPEDYEEDQQPPLVCPLCNMPVTQLIGDLLRQGYIRDLMQMLWVRTKLWISGVGL